MLVDLLKLLQRLVGVGIGLEIGQVLACATIASLVELDAFLNLLSDAFVGFAVGGVEGLVAAEGAAAGRDLPVAVGAAEACVDTELLHTGAEQRFKIAVVGVETAWCERVHGGKVKIYFVNLQSVTGCL